MIWILFRTTSIYDQELCSVCDNQLQETGNNAGESLPPYFFFKFNILLRMSGISLMDGDWQEDTIKTC